jgi:hypothetical protein
MASLDDLVTVGNSLNKNLSQVILAINTKFPNWVTAPATSSSTGTAGQVAYDSSYMYICVSANTWKRISLSAF